MTASRARTKGKAGKPLTVRCAFCRGRGRNPFGCLSPLSECQVCLGKGEVRVTGPVIDCAFCGGSGVHRGHRLTCLVCKGKGVVTVTEPLATCPRCRGRGLIPTDYLPCLTCHGTGVVTSEAA